MTFPGQTVQLEGVFKWFDRLTPINPSDIVVTISNPSSVVVAILASGNFTQITGGVYFGYYTFSSNAPIGDWKFFWDITYSGHVGCKKDVVRLESR